MDLFAAYAALRQLWYPEALRIRPERYSWCLTLVRREVKTEADIPESLARDLANSLFRMERSGAKVKTAPGASEREMGQLRRVMEQVRKVLERHEIEVMDLTGQPIPAGRQDFEILGEPDRVAGLDEPMISFCARPAVMLRGSLIQTAQGTVSIPAPRAEKA
jgi:hypothetical protein